MATGPPDGGQEVRNRPSQGCPDLLDGALHYEYCDQFARACCGQCMVMLNYAETNPGFEKHLHCPFSRKKRVIAQ